MRPNHRKTAKAFGLIGLLAVNLLLNIAFGNDGRQVVVGVLLDGPSERELIPLSAVKKETQELVGNEFSVSFPSAKKLDGAWTVAGIRMAADQLLADPAVDIVLANGLIASHVLATRDTLPKPVIATVVADPVLQKLPMEGGTSGKKNLVYLADDHTVGSDLELFHSLIEFKRLGILADGLFLEALPELPAVTKDAQERLDIDIRLIPLANTALETLAEIPSDIEAVYVPPLPRFNKQAMETLAEGFVERKLPSFSLWGSDSLAAGLLMTSAGRNVDVRRAARRVALNIQAILLGQDAGTLKVALRQPQKLAINMRTAEAIGYSPTWETRERARLLFWDEETQNKLRLIDAMQTALKNNLSLEIEKLSREIAAVEIDRAKSRLLPQLNLGASITQIDDDRANAAFQPERLGRASIDASQLIYSEDARANYDIAKLSSQAQDAVLASVILDVLLDTSAAYLQLLLARAQELVIASNVEVTQQNLELTQERLKIGQVGRGDLLRWESELAIDRQDYYRAQATTAQSATELKRILNLDQQTPISVSDDGIPALIELLSSKQFQRFFNNPRRLATFRSFQVEKGLENAPELRQANFLFAQAERELLARKRAYYVPDLSLVGDTGVDYLRGGRGAGLGNTGIDRDQWSVGIQAAIPLFEGGLRRADTLRAGHQLTQAEFRRADTEQRIRARIISSLQKTSGSYPAIRLSAAAARAAKDNLGLVTSAYSVGTRSITDLIDAQDASVRADLAASQARYNFMTDYVGVLRAVSNFDILLSADALEQWYQDIDAFFKRTEQQ
ncbi:MAG: TolC family protein [Pseudomonadota bacterium]